MLTVAKGSVLRSTFHGTCLSVAGGDASYVGETTTSGTLVLRGKIVLKLPAPLDKSADLPAITVDIPATTTKAESARVPASGIGDAEGGACGATQPGGARDGGASPDDPGASDARSDAAKPTDSGAATPSDSGARGAGSPLPDASIGDAGGDAEGGLPTGSTFSVTVDSLHGTPDRLATGTRTVKGRRTYDGYFYFTAPGFGPGSRVVVTAFSAISGCVASNGNLTQYVEFQPADGSYRSFDSAPSNGACGLAVTQADDARLTGAFNGVVTTTGPKPLAPHDVAIAFDVSMASPTYPF